MPCALDLPAGLARLDVLRASSTNVSILQTAIVSDVALRAAGFACEIARGPHQPDARHQEVGRWASPDARWRWWLDLGRPGRLGLTPGRVFRRSRATTSAFRGSVDAGARRFNLTPRGRYRSLDEVRETVVGGSPPVSSNSETSPR